MGAKWRVMPWFLFISGIILLLFVVTELFGYNFGTEECRLESSEWGEDAVVCDDSRSRRSIRTPEYRGGK
jgi:hypothetical protein